MKYILQHPIHETMNAWTNPAETHAERDTTYTHAGAEKYSGSGTQPKKPVEGEHHLSNDAMHKPETKSIAGQNGPAESDDDQHISDIAAQKANAKSIAGQNGTGYTDEEQRLSDIAENKITRFADFQVK